MLGIQYSASTTSDPSPGEGLSSPLAAARARAERAAATWRARADVDAGTPRWLLESPDVGPTCEMLLADRLFHDLNAAEREGLLAFVRHAQHEDGSWRGLDGIPDLSLTVLGWWARLQAGDDPGDESMLRAQRVVHALGGAQRGNFTVRLWLAMAGHIPWSYLPAIPGELFLLPESAWLSPSRTSPWARGMLTAYYIIATAPARLHLADASSLLLERRPETLVAPRLTRPGLAGDLLQAFDRTVRLARKLPRGAMPRWAVARAEAQLRATQQAHGGWFSVQPTLLALVALRVLGATSDDPRVRQGLDYLRAARGLVHESAGPRMSAQGSTTPPIAIVARLIHAAPRPESIAWLLSHEIDQPGPWQDRADAPLGGWPREVGGRQHLDLLATCEALESLRDVPTGSPQIAPAWAATRRGIDVLLAMQENAGGFSRFERGESQVFMQRLPWTDADLLALGRPDDAAHVVLTAQVLTQLGRTGFREDDDRVARGIRWLQRQPLARPELGSLDVLAAMAEAYAACCLGETSPRSDIEQRLRARQREDGSFGALVDTARAIRGLLAGGDVCVQTSRAARNVVETLKHRPSELEGAADPTTACEVVEALRSFERAGGTLAS